MYILLVAVVAVTVFCVGLLSGKSFYKDKTLERNLEANRSELQAQMQISQIQGAALRSILNGSASPALEAELALNEVNKILYKEIAR